MAVAFSTSGEESLIQRQVHDHTNSSHMIANQWEDFIEIDRCCKWIEEGHYTKVALQFPDEYLHISASACHILREKTGAEMFILADTSYGSCCVDEVAALHYAAEAIIHFGHSCLSPSGRLPILLIFGKGIVDVKDCCQQFISQVPEKDTKILPICSVEFSHAKSDVYEGLSYYYDLVLQHNHGIPSKNNTEPPTTEAAESAIKQIFAKEIPLPAGEEMKNYTILYIGESSMGLTNLMLTFRESTFYAYSPCKNCCMKQDLNVNKMLMKRYYLVEKVKDAQIVGILIATLSVAKYLDIVKRLKKLLTHAGKKYYVISVGKINVAKLANFPDVEVFVLVSCPESVILESSEYYRPIVTPFEVELACDPDREWTAEIELNYSNLLEGGSKYKEIDFTTPVHNVDVSLITGEVRQMGMGEDDLTVAGASGALVARDPLTLSSVSGERFTQQSWQGLDPQLGKTEVTKAKRGRKGIAIQYEEEPS